MRVLTVSSAFPNPGNPGLGIFIRARAVALARGADVVIIAPVACFQGKGFSRALFSAPLRRQDGSFEVFHPRWLNVPGGGPMNSVLLAIALLLRALRLRRRFPFDIIDAHFGYVDGVAAALAMPLLCRPLVITLRGSELVHGRYALRRRAMAWALRRASRVLAVSEELREYALRLGVPSDRVHVVPNGVDSAVFYWQDRAVCRSRFGISPDRRVILSVGNLIESKGHHRILRAAGGLVSRYPEITVLIVGGENDSEPGYTQRLRQCTETLGLSGRVHFLGQLPADEVAQAMSAADVLCLASRSEGCPNVVREALACGTPVVATRVGAVPELISSDEYGIVAPPFDDAALQEAIGSALSRDWNRRKIACWGQSRSWDAVAEDVLCQFNLAICHR